MKITGIVAEYNPFHNGHLYQIEYAKNNLNSDFVIVVMSGNFSQRGTPCISDKFTRSKMALSCGADMIVELPAPLATASAERFCEGAISILNKLNCVDVVCFGSENTNLELMNNIAQLLINEPPSYSNLIKHNLKEGKSYPLARELAIIDHTPNYLHENINLDNFLRQPNIILGIEYIKALIKFRSNIKPFPIKRQVSNYHDTEVFHHFASATALRQAFLQQDNEALQQAMPQQSLNYLQNQIYFANIENINSTLHYKLLQEDNNNLWDTPPKLLHTIYNSFGQCSSFLELVNKCSSKTYSKATVYRTLLRILLNVTSDNMEILQQNDWIPYIRILGCKKEALPLISKIKQTSSVPIVINLKKDLSTLCPIGKILLNYDIKSTQLYHLCTNQTHLYKQDFTERFIIL
ncbi:MAG: hypothetical protein ATN36_06280 [Epulopiscium sp. Nele67-Bin005]|nr:MAG: hypothetical protein ATN36_06280 [Epulopiscium sp. Nele67-Bin005]